MTAPLYDVKNKLSEYVKIAEGGEPVEISKHGKTTVVLVRVEDYSPSREVPPSRFLQVHNQWLKRRRCKEEDYNDVWNYLEEERKKIDPEKTNPWA